MTDLHYISACCTANLTFECIFYQNDKTSNAVGTCKSASWAGLKNLLFGGGGGKRKKVHTIKNEHLSRLGNLLRF